MTLASTDREKASGAGTLFVVATPIGNLGDISLRAIETLKRVATIAAEDTRRARALLSHLGVVKKRLVCIDAHADSAALDALAARIAAGEEVALLTDAGTPSVSDPGSALVRISRARGTSVTVIPGPSAVTTAIAGCGLVDGAFLFLGFVPRRREKRREVMQRIAHTKEAIVLFEAPTRLAQLFVDLAQVVPSRRICLARELTKRFEQFEVRTAAEWALVDRDFRGEVSLVLEPDRSAAERGAIDEQRVDQSILELLRAGLSSKDVAAHLAALTGASRREMYQRVLRLSPDVEEK